VELDTQTILENYSKRWPIEIFFRESKNNLGLKGYQVRSSQSIDRLLLLIVLAYMYCAIGNGRYQRFNIGLKQVRKSVQRDMYEWIYHASENDIPIEAVFLRMKVS
jgi:IS4 transposase